MQNFKRTVLGSLVSLSVASCGGDSKTPAADTATIDTSPTDVADDSVQPEDTSANDVALADGSDTTEPDDLSEPEEVVTPVCGPNDRPACLYRPTMTYEFQTRKVNGLTYTDVSGAERNVNIAIYRPTGAPEPMPVVLMSHGGASGKTDPMKSMEHWGPIIAGAGYLAVGIAHEGRDEASYAALCEALETNPLHVCGVKISWDRPNDVRRVIAYLKEQATEAPFVGLMNLDRIAHVGHSAGASAAMMSVGATRNFKCALPYDYEDANQNCQVADLESLAIDDIDVAISLSPQGPGTEGFMDESFAPMTKPFLMATGANDGDAGEPATRAAIFPLLPAGDKFKFYIDDQAAKHTLFEGDLNACEAIAGLAKCEAMRAAVFATGVAFLDAHLKDSAPAKAWLASEDVVKAGQGLFTFERR